jgi:hypothetical protein
MQSGSDLIISNNSKMISYISISVRDHENNVIDLYRVPIDHPYALLEFITIDEMLSDKMSYNFGSFTNM